MSEYERIWRDWHDAITAARHADGNEPVICIMGTDTYHAFLGALQIRINGIGLRGTERSRVGPLTVEGIDIYPSCSQKTGYFFGHRDEEVIL